MIKIYHNPRCSKSRKGVKILENSKQNFETIFSRFRTTWIVVYFYHKMIFWKVKSDFFVRLTLNKILKTD